MDEDATVAQIRQRYLASAITAFNAVKAGSQAKPGSVEDRQAEIEFKNELAFLISEGLTSLNRIAVALESICGDMRTPPR